VRLPRCGLKTLILLSHSFRFLLDRRAEDCLHVRLPYRNTLRTGHVFDAVMIRFSARVKPTSYSNPAHRRSQDENSFWKSTRAASSRAGSYYSAHILPARVGSLMTLPVPSQTSHPANMMVAGYDIGCYPIIRAPRFPEAGRGL
jgi:hypothetical protein